MKIIRPIEVTGSVLIATNVPETDAPAWAAGTTYAIGNQVIRASLHKLYESLANGNIGNTPETAPTQWAEVSATNPWKMFDRSNTTQTAQAEEIDVTLHLPTRCDSVALLNLDAATVQITMTDAVEGVVFDQSYNLISNSGITDWYAYFFEPIVQQTDLVVNSLPAYSEVDLQIVLTSPGDTARCGVCVLGQQKQLGAVRYGAQLGIQDYSVKTRDAYGSYSVLERAFNKRATATLVLLNSMVPVFQRLLADYRAQPLVWWDPAGDGQLIVLYGFYKEFAVTIEYPTHSLCSLTLEGLT